MGSRGYGDFGSYKPDNKDLKCGDNLGIVSLENINLYEYYNLTNSLPSKGEPVHVEYHDPSQRIVVVSSLNNAVIGALPIKFNFIRVCLDQDHTYSGVVYATSNYPILRVEVEINAI